jgi:chromatin structure-remodeling complex subunit RSC1/2
VAPSPDVDVDVGGITSELDGHREDISMNIEKDAGSEEIVKQLEKSLPKWEGFRELGWMEEVNPVHSIIF